MSRKALTAADVKALQKEGWQYWFGCIEVANGYVTTWRRNGEIKIFLLSKDTRDWPDDHQAHVSGHAQEEKRGETPVISVVSDFPNVT